jgi:hypothetical protein
VIFIALAAQLRRSRGVNQHAARRLFGFSILYLFLLFAALLASSTNRSAVTVSARTDAFGLSQAALVAGHLRATHGPSEPRASEV